MFKTSILYEANYNATEDILINQGGSSSGKTYSILQVLFTRLISEPNIVITVVGESIPNLKAGALRDALDIYNKSPQLKSFISDYNRTDRIFSCINGSVMEFKSYENPQGAKSGKRDYLFINEAQGITYEVFNELHIRTKKQTFIDYNPNAEFWVHEQLIGTPNTKLFISDHRHNPFVPQKIRDKIEALRFKDLDLFKVYGRGMTGKIEGLIFNFNIVDAIPQGAEFIAYGMDWGFTNDPTTFIECHRFNGELYFNELIYQTGLTNSDILAKLNTLNVDKYVDIIADSAEPKSIEDIYRGGYRNIYPAAKGADSIRNSIDTLKQFRLNITKTSINTIKEFRSYKWALDKDGKTTDKPVDYNNHAIDAIRYIALNKINKASAIDLL